MIDSSYIVAGQCYTNKLSAYRAALPKGHWPHWNFHENFFSAQDWKNEPPESLIELYQQRARDIRSRYDYVICWLSGGADSDNVVRSFLETGLHIDEIWHRETTKWHDRQDQGRDMENHCNELRLAFQPRINEYRSRYPHFRCQINTFDVMDLAIPFWEKSSRNPYEIPTYNALLPVKEHKDLCSSKKLSRGRICHVYGIDKPIVRYIDGSWFFVFMDHMVNVHNVASKTGNYDEEFFYWHPNSARLIIKQAHLIKSWFQRNPDFIWCVTKTNDIATNVYNEIVKTIIYPWWNTAWWQPNKFDNEIDWPEIFWFYRNKENRAVQNWHDTAMALKSEILNIYHHVDPLQHNYKEVRGFVNLPSHYSRFYALDP